MIITGKHRFFIMSIDIFQLIKNNGQYSDSRGFLCRALHNILIFDR